MSANRRILSGGRPSRAADFRRRAAETNQAARCGRPVCRTTLVTGQITGFHYSHANVSSGLTWDPATLDRYLANPQEVVPGTRMSFPGLKDPKQRSDVIAYLESLQPGRTTTEAAAP